MSELFDYVNLVSLENDWKQCKNIIKALDFPNKWEYVTKECNRPFFIYIVEDVDDDYHFNLRPDDYIFVWRHFDNGEVQMDIVNFNLDKFKKQVITTFPDFKWPGK